MNIREVVARWLDTALPHRQGPQIGRILSFNTGAGESRYSARIRILTPGSLKETERILEDVPYNPIWAGPNGRGVYAPLPEGTLVIIGYIEFDPSHPYIQGVWGEFYNTADFKADEFLLTGETISINIKPNELLLNGDGFGGLIKIDELKKNLSKNKALLSALLGVLQGPPINESGNGNPSSLQAALQGALMDKSVGDFSQIENTAVKHG